VVVTALEADTDQPVLLLLAAEETVAAIKLRRVVPAGRRNLCERRRFTVVAECAVGGILMAPAVQAELTVTTVFMLAALRVVAATAATDLVLVAIIGAGAFLANASVANAPAAILVLAALCLAGAVAAHTVLAQAVIIVFALDARAVLGLVVKAALQAITAAATELLAARDGLGLITPVANTAAAPIVVFAAVGFAVVVAAGFVLIADALADAAPLAVALLTGTTI
jgi:hypothetical protein